MFLFFLGFLLGVLTIIAVEVLGFLHILNRLTRKVEAKQTESQVGNELDSQQSLSFAHIKQGYIWVLEPEKVPKAFPQDKVTKEPKNKKEILEVFPVKKYAKIKDFSLILIDTDGSQATVQLLGSTIVAVSASDVSSKKWAKRYPIKVESKNAVVYNGSRTCYIFLETSWEKESWCKALRLASCDNKDTMKRFTKLTEEFQNYITSLNAGYPSFMKPYTALVESTDKGNTLDVPSSKVRNLLKRLKRKTSKGEKEIRTDGSLSGRVEKKVGERSRLGQDLFSTTGPGKGTLSDRTINSSSGENFVSSLPSTLTHSGSQGQVSVISDTDSDDKFSIDEGTLCWNLLISRLFFDARRNEDLKTSIQARIQRTLSNMRTPGFIGGVKCTGLDLGNLPPYIHSMRVLPMDMNEVWSMEFDFEYSGGVILDIETRLEVGEPDFQKDILNTSLESSFAREASSDLLEEFENLGSQFNLSKEMVDKAQKIDEGDDKLDAIKNSKSNRWKSPYVSRLKTLLNTIANQVSQVPLTLAIRVSSLRGTLQLHIKPPPSDQLWFGFTTMPDIDFNLVSSVAEHKITSGYVALLLNKKFKAAIRETLVLPNCESVCIPFMLADKNDWVPREVAPFIWIRQETITDPPVREESMPSSSNHVEDNHKFESKSNKQNSEEKHEIPKDVLRIQKPIPEPSFEPSPSAQPALDMSSSNSKSLLHDHSLQDLRSPLLQNDEEEDGFNERKPESPDYRAPRESALILVKENFKFGEDIGEKKIGRRERMRGFGKKMGEKIEEKRRHIEEKSRNIVEKMKGP